MKKLLAIILISLISVDVFACTSAIFTGKCTKDGRPLMWKNRDTGELNNRLDYIKGKKYAFVGLVNSPHKGGEVWAGSNEVGFCIMNTASYNLAIPEEKDLQDGEGVLMYKALGLCRTLKDFENLLDTIRKPLAVEANFGVIDAEGGAAYYEVNTRTWVKFDANDEKLAPEGYLIWTNYSRSGKEDKGMGYVRLGNATDVVDKAYKEGVKFTPEWIMDQLSRSFYHSVLKADLRNSDIAEKTNGWFMDQDFIPRKSTSAISIFQGVKKGEDAANTIYWCGMGYGPLAVMVPVFMKYPKMIPSTLAKGSSKVKKNNCWVCDQVLNLKKKLFPITRGNGNKYFHYSLLYNAEGTGYSQQLKIAENKILEESEQIIDDLRAGTLDKKHLNLFNKYIDEVLHSAYQGLK
ncbi:MAG: hypothetical protein IK041_05605 [Bacteroidales bacterium]|nr:hypothetical protein [Bacteroidales bacterium]